MSRYVGLFALVLGTLLMVNFASDFLYARAIAAQTDEEDEPVIAAANAPSALPLTGLVREEGDSLRILNAEGETKIAKKDVDERSIQKVSIMPEGQEKQMSRQEFLDLIAYLQSLR